MKIETKMANNIVPANPLETKEIMGRRLRSARVMAGLSMEELSAAMEQQGKKSVSKQAISKFEKGVMAPDAETLAVLCQVLKRDRDYFYKPFLVDADNFKVCFRKKSGVSAKAEEALKTSVLDATERYLEVEQMFDIKSAFVNAFSREIVSTLDNIKERAREVRRYCGLAEDAPIPNVQALAEQLGIRVIYVSEDLKVDGLSGWANEKVPIIVLNDKVEHSERLRLTTAHELCHVLFNDCMDASIGEKERETYCQVFANEFLLPEEVFLSYLGEDCRVLSLRELIPLQQMYGISIDAMVKKAYQLGIINESRYRGFFVNVRMNKSFGNYAQQSRYYEERSNRFVSLVYRALASGMISLPQAGRLLQKEEKEIDREKNFV